MIQKKYHPKALGMMSCEEDPELKKKLNEAAEVFLTQARQYMEEFQPQGSFIFVGEVLHPDTSREYDQRFLADAIKRIAEKNDIGCTIRTKNEFIEGSGATPDMVKH